MDDKDMKDVKATVSQFQEETKSNSVLDFVVWLDCKREYAKRVYDAIREKEDMK